MPRAVCGHGRAHKEPGAIAIQVAVIQHRGRDVGFLLPAVKFVADLMTGDDRGLRRREVDALGLHRIQEGVVDRIGARGRGLTRPRG